MKLTYNGCPVRIVTWKQQKYDKQRWHYRVEVLQDDEWKMWLNDFTVDMTRWGTERTAKKAIRAKLGHGSRPKKVTYL